MRNCAKHSAIRHPGLCPICLVKERDLLHGIVEEFLQFGLSPMFDAKASYTTRKSRELEALQYRARDQLTR